MGFRVRARRGAGGTDAHGAHDAHGTHEEEGGKHEARKQIAGQRRHMGRRQRRHVTTGGRTDDARGTAQCEVERTQAQAGGRRKRQRRARRRRRGLWRIAHRGAERQQNAEAARLCTWRLPPSVRCTVCRLLPGAQSRCTDAATARQCTWRLPPGSRLCAWQRTQEGRGCAPGATRRR